MSSKVFKQVKTQKNYSDYKGLKYMVTLTCSDSDMFVVYESHYNKYDKCYTRHEETVKSFNTYGVAMDYFKQLVVSNI